MKQISFKLLVALFLSLILVMSGCSQGKNESGKSSGDESSEPQSKPDSITVQWLGSGVNEMMFNVFEGVDYGTITIIENVYSSLTKYDEINGVYNDVASNVSISEDGLKYTFTIRDDVKFQNGDILTVEDVLFSYQNFKDTNWTLIDFIGANETWTGPNTDAFTIEDGNFVITLQMPDSNLLKKISVIPIVNQSQIEPLMDENQSFTKTDNIVGSGPYKIISSTPTELKLEAYEEYYRGEAKIKNITFRIISDSSTALYALERNEIQAALYIDSMDYPSILANSDLKIEFGVSSQLHYLDFNYKTGNDAIKNPLVRQAINYAVDRKSAIDVQFNGAAINMVNYLQLETSFGYSENERVLAYENNKDLAIELLEQAGYPIQNGKNGIKLKFLNHENIASTMGLTIKEDLEDVGFEIEYVSFGQENWSNARRNGEFDIAMNAMMDYYLDANGFIDAMFASYGFKNATSGYSNPDVDALIESMLFELDTNERKIIIEEIVAILRADAAIVPICFPELGYCMRANIKGLIPQSAVMQDNYYNVYFD